MWEAFFDEIEKMATGGTEAAALLDRATKLILKHKKPLFYAGGGAAATHMGSKALKRYDLGTQLEQQLPSY